MPKSEPASQSQDGVTVVFRDLKQTANMWVVRLELTYPADTPEFESFESWLAGVEVYLERKDGKGRHAVNGGYAIDDSTGRRAALTYRFVEDAKLKLGDANDWKLLCRAPGKLVEMPVRFEFKDVPAP
jgi:hypothetical protein